jgi:hypothetical protein
MLRIKERAPIPYSFVIFTFGFVIESIKELGGALIVVAISLGTNGIVSVFTIFTFIMVATMNVTIFVFNNGVITFLL